MTSTGWRRCWRRWQREADLREIRPGAYGLLVATARVAARRRPRRAASRRAAAAAGARRAGGAPPLHRALDPQLRDRHGLLPARVVHDEVQPADQRAARR